MRAVAVRLWTSLTRYFSAPRQPAPRRPAARLLEHLEERVVPSTAQPAGCRCPNCAGGAAYTLGGGVPGSSPAAIKWPQPAGLGSQVTVTYSYSNLLDGRLGGGLSSAAIKAAVQEAFGRWAAVAPLRFVEVADSGPSPSANEYAGTGRPMIRLGHRAIDGAYNVLAYGYYPGASGLSGDVHFDQDEVWSTNPAFGRDLLEVATHEIGHALGLAHSNVGSSIMSARYGGYYAGLGSSFLFADDINGVRALYGAGRGSVNPAGVSLPPGQTFTVVGKTLYVQGTSGVDTFTFEGDATPKVQVNTTVYTGDLRQIRAVVFLAYEGSDRAYVVGTGNAEAFALKPGVLTMTGPTWNLTVAGSELIDVRGEAGDTVTMADSAGDDTLVARPGSVQLTGPGYQLVARTFAAVTATATAGGQDRAYLYDSAGTDTLIASRAQAVLLGNGYRNAAVGFDAVYAYSTGYDNARFYGSTGNDLFVASTAYMMLQGQTFPFVVFAYGFDRAQVEASLGFDVARLYGTAAAETVLVNPAVTTLQGAGFEFEAVDFDQVYAYGNGGNDQAVVYDSAGNDRVVRNGTAATIYYPDAAVQWLSYQSAVLYGLAGGVNQKTAGLPATWVGAWVAS